MSASFRRKRARLSTAAIFRGIWWWEQSWWRSKRNGQHEEKRL
jgi:hypothetical protein